jgi:hypothetical protein
MLMKIPSAWPRAVVALACAAACSWAAASGNDAGGSAETGDAAMYNQGKAVYATRYACSSCTLAGKSLDATSARGLLTDKGSVTLSAAEAQALDVYLKRRFKL